MGEEPRGQERRNAQMAIARMVLGNWRQKLVSARAMIRKVLFLIGNRHFLIRKRPFGVPRCRYVGGVLVPQQPLVFLPQEFFK